MTAFSKADVQNVRIGTNLNGCFWPKADIQQGEAGLLVRGLQRNVPWFGVDYSPDEKNVCGGLDLGDVLDVIADWL